MNNTLSTTEKMYVTMPMSAMSATHVATSACSNEEEVYTSFEQAITTRLLAYQGYRVYARGAIRSSSPSRRSYPETGPISHKSFPELTMRSQESQESQKKRITQDMMREATHTKLHIMLFCFAIMCILAGFDLMGLLILHLR